MKFAIALALISTTLTGFQSFADGNYDDQAYDASKAVSCIVVLQKHSGGADQPSHFEMDCDGYRFLYQQTSDISVLSNPTDLENALSAELEKRIVVDSNTICNTAENDTVWYTNCYRASSFAETPFSQQ